MKRFKKLPSILSLWAAVAVSPVVGQVITEDIRLNAAVDQSLAFFGTHVAVDQGVVAVGSHHVNFPPTDLPGDVSLYDVLTGNLLRKIQSNDIAPEDAFGSSVALQDGILVATAYKDNVNGPDSGSAYVFDATTGVQLAKLVPNDGEAGEFFGTHVAMWNGMVAIGAIHDNDNGIDSGSVYIFDIATGAQIREIHANDASPFSRFASGLAIDNGTLVVLASNAGSNGAIYTFDMMTGSQIRKITPHLDVDSGFGVGPLVIEGNRIAVGVPGESFEPGVVLVYDKNTGALLRVINEPGASGFIPTNFGRSLALDFNVLVIGASEDFVFGNFGSVHLYDITTGVRFDQFVSDSIPDTNHFGLSVAIESGLVIAAAPSTSFTAPGSGTVHVYNLFGQLETAVLLPPFTDPPFDRFGTAVAVQDGLLAATATETEIQSGTSIGSAYLYNAITGVQISEFGPFNAVPLGEPKNSLFGISIAMSDDFVAVGASADTESGTSSGAAYFYRASTGALLNKVFPNTPGEFMKFGDSVALELGRDFNNMAVGASNADSQGAVYMFNPVTGVQQSKITPDFRQSVAWFGKSVDMDKGILVVGSPLYDETGLDSGSAYVFDLATGTQLHQLDPGDTDDDDVFGWSVSISEDIVAVGAWGHKDNTGSVYVFDATSGNMIQQILLPNGKEGDLFGISVSIDKGLLLVGAHGDDAQGFATGASYLFNAMTGELITTARASDAAGGAAFGSAVAIGGDHMVIGAISESEFGESAGAVYVFSTPQDCPADLTGDGELNFFDVSAFLQAFTAGDPAGDFNGDGMFNFFDVSAFLNAFNAGCP